MTQYAEHSGVQNLISDLNNSYKELPALWEKDVFSEGFQWLVGDDAAANTLSFIRWSDSGTAIACISNFSPVPHENYRLPLPKNGSWVEILNTDDDKYGGSGVTNKSIVVEANQHRGFDFSTVLRVPPLGTVWLELK